MNLNYKVFGEGYPVVILHGLFGTLDNWQTIAKKLAEHYLVFILDLRNHGRSPHHDVFNYDAMAEDVQSFLESQWIYEAHIIGHSMGGKVAMQLAFHFPDWVNKLVVVDISPKSYEGGHQAIFDALFSLNLPTIESRKKADAQLKTKIENFGVRQFLLKNLNRNKTTGNYQWKMNLPVIHKNYENILAAVESDEPFEKPALFIRGGQSNYILEKDIHIIKTLFPLAIIETIPEAGHWVHAESPISLLNLLIPFLKNR